MKENLTTDDVVWYIGDRHKDITAAIEAREFVDCKIIPFAYGLNAAIAVLDKNIGADHIIMNYHDFTLQTKRLIEKELHSYQTKSSPMSEPQTKKEKFNKKV